MLAEIYNPRFVSQIDPDHPLFDFFDEYYCTHPRVDVYIDDFYLPYVGHFDGRYVFIPYTDKIKIFKMEDNSNDTKAD